MTEQPLTQHVMIKVARVDEQLWHTIVKHEAKIRILIESGVLDLEFGKATISMHEGRVQNVMVEKREYQYVAPKA